MYIRVVKNNFYVFRNYFEETEFSEKFTSCLVHTRTLSIIFSDFWDKFFRKVFKTASYTFRRTLWWKTIRLKNFLQSFGLWSKQFFLTDDIFFVAKLSKLLSTTSTEHFDKNFLLKNTSSFFPDREHFLFWLSAKLLERIVQTLFYVFRKPFEDADFFNFLFSVHIQILSKFFWHLAQTFS